MLGTSLPDLLFEQNREKGVRHPCQGLHFCTFLLIAVYFSPQDPEPPFNASLLSPLSCTKREVLIHGDSLCRDCWAFRFNTFWDIQGARSRALSTFFTFICFLLFVGGGISLTVAVRTAVLLLSVTVRCC